MDIGAIKENGQEFHSGSLQEFCGFLRGSKYVCGHNILNHDLKYLEKEITKYEAHGYNLHDVYSIIDTLYLSPLLFPKKPYHYLVKDDKLAADELNNPFNDAKKARDLFHDEAAKFEEMEEPLREIYYSLLGEQDEFKGFFHYIGYNTTQRNISRLILETFAGRICENAPVRKLAEKYPIELCFALSQINVIQYDSITPPWVLKNYPRVENVLHFLRSRKCASCAYCAESLDETRALSKFFHFDEFKSYKGKPLQKDAVRAAIDNKSILVIFPTGGGKSIAFQLPALMAGVNEKGLTVVISPLQSLMKDQTDNLEKLHHITEAVTINSSLDPLERAKAFERVEDGSANILYISPESLRSNSIELLLLKRNVVRFVIDEAHCFSSWGQDFRVDYLYIGDFISGLQKKKNIPQNAPIPVSCFTATAKQKVIADIKDYFKEKLSLDLEVFKASSARENLAYHILSEEDDEGKYSKLRQLITDNDCPTIVYVSRTKTTEHLARKLTENGYPAKPYHGQMEKQLRADNQDAFMSGEVKIIVATTAFGMGVDKKDVGMVIHYDISDSLENYVQEAGRAGRDEKIKADCYVLYNDEDLNKHFIMLNQTKLSQKEIQQIWKGIKELTRLRTSISQSALEIARKSGWDGSVRNIETRVKTAINALEQSKFVKRGQNMSRVFADSILTKNMEEARTKIDGSARFDDASREQAIRIISSLISARSKTRGKDKEGEERVEYIADRLGIGKEDVIRVIGLLREEKILADAKDLSAYIKKRERINRSKTILDAHINIEKFLFSYLDENERKYHIKEMNEALAAEYPGTSIHQLGTVLNYYSIKHLVKRTREYKNYVTLKPYFSMAEMRSRSSKRFEIAKVIIEYLFSKNSSEQDAQGAEDVQVDFSILELKEEFNRNLLGEKARIDEIEDALYYLLKIDAINIEGGFLVIYNPMRIERLEKDTRAQYKKEHYARLEEYYQNKRQQIHIVGEYANRMINDYSEALAFVDDYFEMDYEKFLNKYFKGRSIEINRNITTKKFAQLFGELSPAQSEIIKDHDSKYIVVAAGPGSGKTKLLTHKLASLYIMEDVKHEQMLMLTFSRAAATEFKKRLMMLIGGAANFIQITTFHSYCFDLLGVVGNIEKSDDIIKQTVEKIRDREVELTRLTKTVLVIDEAQDMSEAEFSLVKTLMEENDNLRVIAVGDDDQNIYEWRGSNSAHFESLLKESDAKKYELVDNYRSNANIVEFANQFAKGITHRFKTTPIKSVKNESGIVSICTLNSANIVVPVVQMLQKIRPSGSTCIITRTNEEVLTIAGLLHKNGISARKIQTNDGFSLYDLAELRTFIEDVCKGNSSVITDDAWRDAIQNLNAKYADSNDLPAALKLIVDFSETAGKTRYKSDLKQFVRESKFEDFISASADAVLVSTIHQAKGREFDNVFLALSRFPDWNDPRKREEIKRAIYVAITRAKQNLHIVCNGNYFDKIYGNNIERTNDTGDYPAPSQINLQLSHKDVWLDFFVSRKKEIDSLVSGRELSICETGCLLGSTPVLRFSKKFCAQIQELGQQGYFPARAVVRHIVFWQGEEKEEIKIILPDLEFSKK